MSYQILTGDALTLLRTLPDSSVQTCITSPPYYGLRDYGTARWRGGRKDCPHRAGQLRRGVNLAQSPASTRGGAKKAAEVGWLQAREVCRHCGARRVDRQLGLERTPEEYVARLVAVFREVRRVLADDGTLWLNLGDGFRGKNLLGMPWRMALALQADGWYLRSDIIWHKPNPMPESVRDRPTKSHEYLFLLSKSRRYYYDCLAIQERTTGNAHDRSRKHRAREGQKTFPTAQCNGIRAPGVNPKAQKWPNAWSAEPGRHDGIGNGRFRPKQNASFSAAVVRTVDRRNKRTVWTIPTFPFPQAHFATFPPRLVEPCVLAGSRAGDTVLDPFAGAGTTGLVALAHGRRFLGIELNPRYVRMALARLDPPALARAA